MKQGLVRIIGGKWRGRRLRVPDVKDLRPTPDRVRETLFNWLAPVIQGSRCLDLFAGSGALGFEALSRGAAYVMMVDQSIEVVKLLQSELKMLAADHVDIYHAKIHSGLLSAGVLEQMLSVTRPFDIVFLDPPFQENLLLPCSFYLEEHGFLSQSTYIYLEARRLIKDNELPLNWRLIKSQRAGQVFYHLAHRTLT